jgi:hypothetical protein
MRFRSVVLLVVLSSGVMFAQTTTVPDTDKTAIDLAQTKVENTQLKASQLQSQYQSQMQSFQKDFETQQKALNDAIDAEKKKLKLPDNATFDQKNFSFTVPPAPKKDDTAAKK